MTVHTGCIIQARMDSSRLPGKVMMMVEEGKPVINFVLSQLSKSKMIDKIIVATTNLSQDEEIVNCVKNLGFDCFRGSSDDVLDRYYKCAKKYSISTIVRITADNPLIDPTIVDQTIEEFNTNYVDYVTNCRIRTFPYGTEVEVFSFDSLEKAWKNAGKPSEREHVTPYFYNNPGKFKIFDLKFEDDISHLRWTVDRINDLKLVQKLASKIHNRPILMKDITNLLSKEPSLIEINKDYVHDEGYKKSLKEDKEYFD